MSSIADALKRAQEERQRMRPSHESATVQTDVSPDRTHGPSLASVVLRRNPSEHKRSLEDSQPGMPAAEETEQPTIPALVVADKPPETPPMPLTTAIRQAPSEPPPAVRNEQRAAETIVEDYTSKRKLNLPPSIVVYHERSGQVAEQYRCIRDKLMTSVPLSHRESQAYVITSSRQGEGKTVSVLNLGLSLVEIRSQRVLLIDGCLQSSRRLPSLSESLRLSKEAGLAEILASPATDAIDPFLKATPWHNLFLLPAGACTTSVAAANLLQSQNLRALLRRVRSNFDWIFIDAPAAATLPDAGLLGHCADGILLTVALHHTPHHLVQTTIRRLRSMNLPLKSCILTRA